MTGRPSLLTPEITNKFVDLTGNGVRFEAAARACGISDQTARNWRQRGEKTRQRIDTEGEPQLPDKPTKAQRTEHRKQLKEWREWLEREQPFLDFFDEYTRARGELEASLMLHVRKAAREVKNWQAALKLLQILFGNENPDYNPETRVKSDVKLEGKVKTETDRDAMSAAELAAYVAGKEAEAYLTGVEDGKATEKAKS